MSTAITNEQIIETMQGFAQRVKTLLPSLYTHTPKACINTYGCQQNVSDSERIKGVMESMGYIITENQDEADFVLFNTCAVRGHAEDRVFGNIGTTKRLKKEKDMLIIAVCGCMAQQQTVCDRVKTSYPYVDILFGTHHIHKLPEYIYRRLTGSPRIFDISDDFCEVVEGLPIHRDGKIKGWLPIMHGCDNFCTYCIVPYVRGREHSRRPEDIIAEAKQMISMGFKEITLLGQNVNSYGKGLNCDINFAKLLRRLNALEGDFRIRFMTSHPKDCTTELLDAVRDCEKVERHLHLPFQSGSDKILKNMNRRYTSSDYLNLIKAAKERIDGVTFTSDIIVGFPGETYEDFTDTLRVVKEVGFQAIFTFIYSPRTGTPAASMPDPISREEKGRWFDQLLALQEEISKQNYTNYVGTVHRVLCEEVTGEGMLGGKTSGAVQIEFEGSKDLVGQFVDVRVDRFTNILEGTKI